MPDLRANRAARRNPRRKKASKCKRRNLVKFIPRADSDFALTAGKFARYIEDNAEACGVQEHRVTLLRQAVEAYRAALKTVATRSTCTPIAIAVKQAARKEAEQIVREVANMIRGNVHVEARHKQVLRINERRKRLKKRTCPQRPPLLRFVGSGDGVSYEAGVGNGSGVHVLEMWDVDPTNDMWRKSKPDGAVRLELFVDLVPVGQPVPGSPLDRLRAGRGFPWYLRSFTKSPMEVVYPIPSQPMLVVYWGRWADSAGEVSMWSATCVARIEGYTSEKLLPEGDQERVAPRWSIAEPAALPAGARSHGLQVVEPKLLPSAESHGEVMIGAMRREECVIMRLPSGVITGS
ncbi:MAG: hypothetical protein ACR2GY_03205 [Phycisphaerales bacterium]